jgi:L-malate glycosyltransferase
METHSQPHVVIVAASLDILGGQSVQAQALIQALTRDGYPVTFIPINPRFPRALRWLRRLRYLRTLANQILYFPSLFSLARADVVHVFSASYTSFLLAPLPALVVARVLNKRIVLHYHSGEAGDHLAHWGVLVHPWLKLADMIVVPSEYLAGVFARHGYHTRVIPNLVDLSRFEYRARQPIRPRLLSTRNLEPYYRVGLILDAFALVRAERPDATLTVAGSGREESRLRRVAGEGVRFIGKVDPPSMPQVYAEADIFVNASVVDNQPVSILEAFASGLPVVSTPAGDIPAMVRHNHTGLLVGTDDAASLASAILQLITHPREAFEMAQQARQDATRYTWPAVRQQWAAVYTERRYVPATHTVREGDV